MTADRLADLVDLHRAHALVVGRGVEPADLEARQIIHQEGVGAHAVERADVAGQQRAPLLVGEIEAGRAPSPDRPSSPRETHGRATLRGRDD